MAMEIKIRNEHSYLVNSNVALIGVDRVSFVDSFVQYGKHIFPGSVILHSLDELTF